MDDATIAKLREQASHGMQAVKTGQTSVASKHFYDALNLAEEVQDSRKRRDEITTLALIFESYGFPDLSLMAAEMAVALDRSLGLDGKKLCGDLLAVGNAHVNLGNTQKAESIFREALELSLQANDWADAASANTNIGSIVANQGNLAGAIKMFEESLSYLAKAPFDDTERITRVGLLQAMELEGYDVDRAMENATQLCSRFWDHLRGDERRVVEDFVTQLVERYLQVHPHSNTNAWKKKTFPILYGGER